MRCETIQVSSTQQSIYAAIGGSEHCQAIILQAPSGNAADVNVGDEKNQAGFVSAGNSLPLPVKSLNEVHVSGTSGDSVVVLIFES
jgi:hypothetical protein